ncbi:MAG: hypothetical protein C4308_07215 [Chitinophagaceae bacterium]
MLAMKKLLIGSTLFTAFFLSCTKDQHPEQNLYSIFGIANGGLQIPPNSSAAVASISGTYNANANRLEYNIVWTGLGGPATVVHFHSASGTTLYPINVDVKGTSGTASGGITIADSVENALLAGRLYYDIHTEAYPDGEIRGQIGLRKDTTSSN